MEVPRFYYKGEITDNWRSQLTTAFPWAEKFGDRVQAFIPDYIAIVLKDNTPIMPALRTAMDELGDEHFGRWKQLLEKLQFSDDQTERVFYPLLPYIAREKLAAKVGALNSDAQPEALIFASAVSNGDFASIANQLVGRAGFNLEVRMDVPKRSSPDETRVDAIFALPIE